MYGCQTDRKWTEHEVSCEKRPAKCSLKQRWSDCEHSEGFLHFSSIAGYVLIHLSLVFRQIWIMILSDCYSCVSLGLQMVSLKQYLCCPKAFFLFNSTTCLHCANYQLESKRTKVCPWTCQTHAPQGYFHEMDVYWKNKPNKSGLITLFF